MRVLFLCLANSCRSQMAEGILNSGGAGFRAHSAGAKPTFVHPFAIRVMAEAGIDISGHTSKSVDKFMGQEFDYVITVCGDTCPVFQGKAGRMLHWDIPDPATARGSEEERLSTFRTVRDAIKKRIDGFLKDRSS